FHICKWPRLRIIDVTQNACHIDVLPSKPAVEIENDWFAIWSQGEPRFQCLWKISRCMQCPCRSIIFKGKNVISRIVHDPECLIGTAPGLLLFLDSCFPSA